MKAYCGKCRYGRRPDWGMSVCWCEAPDNVYMADTPEKPVKRYRQEPHEKNASNDCPSYVGGQYFPYGLVVVIVVIATVVLAVGSILLNVNH